MHTTGLLAALLAPVVVSAQLHELAVKAGLQYFGTCIGESASQSDTAYMNILSDKREFGQLVPENGQKWDATEGTRGRFTYTQGDISASAARRNGQLLRCHTLVWHSQLPNWVASGSWNRQTLTEVIESHINNVMDHYRGQCLHWDVLNEAVDDNGSYRNSVFYRVFGTDYFPLVFNLAKKADPVTKLYYNDYNLEYNGAKTEKTVELVKIIQAAKAPIEGVGFQAHLIVGTTPNRAQLATVLRRFTSLNLDVAYTELDIRHETMPPNSQALSRQGTDYANVVGSCLDVDRCVGVTVWGYTDKYSWVPGTFPGTGAALLYDDQLRKKAAWTSVSSVLAAAATGSNPNPQPTTIITTTRPATTPTSTPVVVEPTPTPSSPASGSEAQRWGQCGGQGWSGPTRCVAPYTCTYGNPWYSQCL
ncbi:glycoside hydrolase superfamily [Schizothecium vesticola]|uniref:Beta-xylanase n=1 Tax=Schizothecium vesticola TaxID=314040 RepID=A0AA40K9F5_9PEZI|nr:glycoside hydrolase superfamily [Schizothecium vesticola]